MLRSSLVHLWAHCTQHQGLMTLSLNCSSHSQKRNTLGRNSLDTLHVFKEDPYWCPFMLALKCVITRLVIIRPCPVVMVSYTWMHNESLSPFKSSIPIEGISDLYILSTR